MKKNIFVVVILIILIIAGYLVYQLYDNKKEDLTEDWETYVNQEYGYSFKYPKRGEVTLQEVNRVVIELKTESGEYGGVLDAGVKNQCPSVHMADYIVESRTVRLGETDFIKQLAWGRAALNTLAKTINYHIMKDGLCFYFMFAFIHEEESWYEERPGIEEAMDVEDWDKIVSTFGFVGSTTDRSNIIIVSPNGGEKYKEGEAIFIEWTAFNADRIMLDIQNKNGGSLGKLSSFPFPNTGSFWFTATYNLPPGEYKIRAFICPDDFMDKSCWADIESLSVYGYDESDDYFIITE